jgi:hypothetical protein
MSRTRRIIFCKSTAHVMAPPLSAGIYCVQLSTDAASTDDAPMSLSTTIRHFPWPHTLFTRPEAIRGEEKNLGLPSQPHKCELISAEVSPFRRSEEPAGYEPIEPLPPPSISTSPATVWREPEACGSSSKSDNDETFFRLLSDSVRRRVISIPHPTASFDARVAVLFSGGVDCALLAAMVDLHLPPGEPIDLINVAFSGKVEKDVYPPTRLIICLVIER